MGSNSSSDTGGSNNNDNTSRRSVRYADAVTGGSNSSNQTNGNGNGRSGAPSNAPSTNTTVRSLRSNIRMVRSVQLKDDVARHLRSITSDTIKQACVDGGADTCLFNANNVFVESTSERTTELHMVGAEGHRSNVKIGTVITCIKIQGEEDPVLLVFHESMIGEDNDDINIISANQVRSFGHDVNDCPKRFNGKQAITLQSSQTSIPILLKRALMTIPFRKPTSKQLEECERIVMTSDEPWSPELLMDSEKDHQGNWEDRDDTEDGDVEEDEWRGTGMSIPALTPADLDDEEGTRSERWTAVATSSLGREPTVDEVGYYQRGLNNDYHVIAGMEKHLGTPPATASTRPSTVCATTSSNRKVKHEMSNLRPRLGWVPEDTVRKTLEATT